MEKEKYKLLKSEMGIVSEYINKEGVEYNLPFAFEIKNYDYNKVLFVLENIIFNNDVFKTRYINDIDGIKKIKIEPSFKVEVIEYPNDLRELVQKFDLFHDNLFRFYILENKDKHYLFFDFYHSIMDGTSINLFIKDFFELYYNENSIYDEKKSIFDSSTNSNETYISDKEYYKGIYLNNEVDSLPIYDKKDDVINGNNLNIRLDVDRNILNVFLKNNNIKTSSYFNLCFSYLLKLLSLNDEILYLTIFNGRNDLNKNLYGMFVRTMPFYFKFNSFNTLDELNKLNDLINNFQQHNNYFYSDVYKDLNVSSNVMFAYQGDEFFRYKDILADEIKTDAVKDILLFEVFRDESGYYLNCSYRSDLYDLSSIELYMSYFNIIASTLFKVSNLNDIDLCTGKIKEEIDNYNKVDLSYLNEDETITKAFSNIVHKYKDNIAVVCNDVKYTYKELDLISNRIANKLIEEGVTKDDVVPILINRNSFMVFATYGVIKTGAAYMPLDSTYPSDRLNYMVKDANCKYLVLERSLDDKVSFDGTKIYLDDLDNFKNDNKIKDNSKPYDLFVMLYTSGTTGQPKGVLIENINVYSFAKTHIKEMKLDNTRRVAAYASYGFDACLMDLHATLLSGACLYIVDDSLRLDLLNLGKKYDEWEITDAFMTTSVGRQFVLEVENHHLINFSTGGEKLVPIDPKCLNYNLYNLYGPTECVVYSNKKLVDKTYYRVPIGKNISDFKIYVLDNNLNRLPYLIPGILYLSGPQVARGYLNKKEANSAFSINKFDSYPFDRLYNTGDVVRLLPNGDIDFIGRKDSQIKIRGFRIELTEVEQIIRDYSLVKDATVNAYTDQMGIKYLVGYVVSDKKIDFNELKKFILSKKPSYMCPKYFMQIDSIPYNQNHKVNKKALPLVTNSSDNIVKAKTKTEEKVLSIVKNILGYDISTDEDLDEAGLTSVSIIKFVVSMSKEFNKAIKTKDLENLHNIIDVANFIDNLKDNNQLEVLDDYPLSYTQNGIFVESVAQLNSTIYNIPLLFELDKRIDLNRLIKSIYRAINNHKYINSILFSNENGDVRIKYIDNPYEIKVIEIDKLDKNDLIKPFTLLNSLLYRIDIYKVVDKSYLFLDFNHIIMDGTSINIFLKDVSNAYLDKELEKEILSGYEIALIEEKERNSKDYDSAKEYYANYLSRIENTDSLIKKELTNKKSKLAVADYSFNLDLNGFVNDNKLSYNALFNLAFAYTLSKYNNQNGVYYTTIFDGRNDSRYLNTTTMLVHTLPIYEYFDECENIIKKIKITQKELNGLESNSIYSFQEALNQYNLNTDVMFVYQGDLFKFDEIAGYRVKNISITSDVAKSKFGIDVFKDGNNYRLHAEYDEELYTEGFILNFLNSFEKILNEFITKETFGNIELITENDINKYERFNDTEAEIKYEAFYHYLEDSALKYPDKIAVIGKDTKYTYKEFNEACNKVAHALLHHGAKIGDKTIMLMPRVAKAYVVREGILKSGTAFVPIDPKYPNDRINYIINDSDSKFLITTKDILNNNKDLFKNLNISTLLIEDILESKDISNLNLDIKKDDLAYLIYTSGSTGKPKGVMLKEENLCNYVTHSKANTSVYEYEKNGPDSVSCSFASFSFDASLQEECVPLSLGHTIYIASEEDIENPLILSKHLEEYNVDTMFLTPSYVSNILDFDDVMRAFRKFKTLDMGAENVPISLALKLREKGVKAALINGYGPTETTITSTYSRDVLDGTIGKPMVNTKLYIVDSNNRMLPIGATGELVICGNCVGLGYYKLEEKTKQSFITFNDLPAYKTGDMARYNNDGNIEFFGRKDNQIKLHGLRIELDEIENNILKYDGITRVKVVVKNSSNNDYLAAYFTASKNIDVLKLKEAISKNLTEYMVPQVFMQLDQMPLTQNGKIDKNKLPEIVIKENNHEIIKPCDKLEEDILEIFSKVLNKTNLSVLDDFFSNGGTSLLASKVIMIAISRNINISYKDVFEYSTARSLRNHLSSDLVLSKETSKEIITLNSLKENVVSNVDKIKMNYKMNKILLTGSTGFLGIHLLKDLIKEGYQVYALVREKKLNKDERLKALLEYYFNDTFDKYFGKTLFTINADVTDQNLTNILKDYDFDTVINCAALVKHFAHDESIFNVNYKGALNVARIALKHKARFIQISTLSVAGLSVDDKISENVRLHEYELDLGQDVSNKYINSKFEIEKELLRLNEKENLDLKIIRVGNLMGRNSDGEFQINSITNNFMRNLYSYVYLKSFPISELDSKIDFSPIDSVSLGIIKLSQTNKEFTVFHLANSHTIDYADVIHVLNKYGKEINIVDDLTFNKKLASASKEANDIISSLVAYNISDGHTYRFIESDNGFTTKILYRLGFRWPITDESYLEKLIEAIDTLGFFQRKDV